MTENVDVVDTKAKVEGFTPKDIAKLFVNRSVKFVVAGAITSLVPPAETRYQKAKLFVGSYVIADMVVKNTGTYVDEKIDSWKKDIRDIRAAVKAIESSIKTDKEMVPCPVCKSLAEKVLGQENTVYCSNKNCGFMGILPSP